MSKSSSRFSAAALVTFFGLVTVLTTYGFASKDWLPVVASEHGVLVDGVIAYLLITTGVIFVIGHGVLICFVWRYSVPDEDSSGEGSSDGSTSRPAYKPVSRKTEWKWALIPVLVMAVVSEVGVLFLGIPVFKDVYGETPADAVQAEVVAYQFGWFVRYPGADGKFGRTDPKLVHRTDNPVGLVEEDPDAKDDVVVPSGLLFLPVDRVAFIRLRSHDVLHSFCIPQFRVKQDIVPGFTATTQFKPTKTGQFEIACAELCGLGHYEMRGLVDIQTVEEFESQLVEEGPWFGDY